jgi:Gas vesicle protein
VTQGSLVGPSSEAAVRGAGSSPQVANLGDILERVLDKGLVIAGDIQVNLLDIELLTIKLRLVIASLETAKEVGIDWWESDPWLSRDAAERSRRRELDESRGRELERENDRLRRRIEALESAALESAPESAGRDGNRK